MRLHSRASLHAAHHLVHFAKLDRPFVMNDYLGGSVSGLNIKYSKVVLQICPQGVDADCS